MHVIKLSEETLGLHSNQRPLQKRTRLREETSVSRNVRPREFGVLDFRDAIKTLSGLRPPLDEVAEPDEQEVRRD